jgi:hypothetical protein
MNECFYFLRRYPNGSIVCACYNLYSGISPERYIQNIGYSNPDRDYMLIPDSCVKKVYGNKAPLDSFGIKWTLGWPKDKQ